MLLFSDTTIPLTTTEARTNLLPLKQRSLKWEWGNRNDTYVNLDKGEVKLLWTKPEVQSLRTYSCLIYLLQESEPLHQHWSITFFLPRGSGGIVCDHSQLLLLRFGLFLKDFFLKSRAHTCYVILNLHKAMYFINIHHIYVFQSCPK